MAITAIMMLRGPFILINIMHGIRKFVKGDPLRKLSSITLFSAWIFYEQHATIKSCEIIGSYFSSNRIDATITNLLTISAKAAVIKRSHAPHEWPINTTG